MNQTVISKKERQRKKGNAIRENLKRRRNKTERRKKTQTTKESLRKIEMEIMTVTHVYKKKLKI